ncbi:Ig-like domain-containing protein [Clostridium frigoris]|uniref:Ig-like domain-containing protein n=1 Tax=Clostridium frigoris TaxID=205327 RepID=A0ABS6BWV0_9CLOT|nr:Ig-like domain-containing protein [Clostridium frigoris]MBU3160884.1 Ig-like domain-containing protein [Clostridium frigoris]
MISKKNRKGFLITLIAILITISIPFMGNVHASVLKSITSIEDINTTVDVNDRYTLQKTLAATKGDGSTKAVAVKWNPSKASTSKAGTFTYRGTVAGYDEKVNLILTVIGITSMEDINETVDLDDSYTLPKTLTATRSDGRIETVTIKWSPSKASTKKAGTFNFKGTVAGYDKKVNLKLVVNNTNTTVYKSTLELYKPTSNDDADSIVADALKSDFSVNTSIDVSGDKYLAYQLEEYNSDNVSLGFDSNPDITIATSRADVVTVEVVDKKIVVIAGKAGIATIVITDSNTNTKYKIKITVVDEENIIKSVSWKSVTNPTHAVKYDYTKVLTTTSSDNDPKVSGINLSKSSSYTIRIQLVDMVSGMLYVDKNGNGTYDLNRDTTIGTLSVLVLGRHMPADDNYTDGITVKSGEDCNIIFVIKDKNGNAVPSKSIIDNF